MRFAYRTNVGCGDHGRRVTVRYRTSDGKASDVVGILEACDEGTFGIRNRRGELVTVRRETVLASKVVES
jgi:hypothetical protein